MQVRALIAAHDEAVAADDRTAARDALEAMEGEAYRNEADWAVIRDFMQREGFGGRLEIVTNALIRKGRAETGQPYFVLAELFVRSGRRDQARPLIEKYKSYQQAAPASGWDQRRWEFANLLFQAGMYRDCLAELEGLLQLEPAQFGCLILQARTLWRLDENRLALKKLKALKSHLGDDFGRWQWYASTAFEFGELGLGQSVTAKVIKMLEQGAGRLNGDVAFLLNRHGFAEDLNRLVFTADPSRYNGLWELNYVFDLALKSGARQTATSFGQALLKQNPDARLRGRIEQFFAEPGFLMA